MNCAILCIFVLGGLQAAEIYVSPQGNDSSPGSKTKPLRTLAAAQRAARRTGARQVRFPGGVYYLTEMVGETGVLVLEVPAASEAFRMGLRRDDVVLGLGGVTVDSVATLRRAWGSRDAAIPLQLQITRNQGVVTLGSFPGKVSEWKGFTRYDFELAGRMVTVVAPAKVAAGSPWLWRGEFIGAFATVDEALLKLGWHVVYMACPNTFGSPDTMQRWSELYGELTRKHGFSRRPVLLGMSRGGLYVYNWAAAHPETVGLIYGDAPVCDVKSWPGGKGTGKGSPHDWELFRRCMG